MTPEERYLNLAIINLGEAITELGNVRQRGAMPGSDYANVKLAMSRAAAALEGVVYSPPEADAKHKE